MLRKWIGIFGGIVIAAVGVVWACQLLPTDEQPEIIQQIERLHLSLVGETGGGDSLLIGVAFDTISDPSGIDRVNWQNWGIAPPEITADTSAGMTKTMVDTITVRKPPINSVDTYNIRAHSVDKASNAGGWSDPHEWSIVHGDTTGPFPPGIVIEDTLKIYTDVTIVSVIVYPNPVVIPGWSNSDWTCVADSIGCVGQAIALSIYDDGGVLCTDGAYNQQTGDGDRDRSTPYPWSNPDCELAATTLGVNYTLWAGRRYSYVEWSAADNGDVEKSCVVSYLGEAQCYALPPPNAAVYEASRKTGPIQLALNGALKRKPIAKPGSRGFYGLE